MAKPVCASINSLLLRTLSLIITTLANFDPLGSNLASESASDTPIVPVSVSPWATPALRPWIPAVFQFLTVQLLVTSSVRGNGDWRHRCHRRTSVAGLMVPPHHCGGQGRTWADLTRDLLLSFACWTGVDTPGWAREESLQSRRPGGCHNSSPGGTQ